MAMNKKEQAYVALLEKKLSELEALQIFSPEINPDLSPPTGGSVLNGYIFNSHGEGRVSKACTSSIGHCVYQWDVTTSQQPIYLFSTELLAYKALRRAMENKFAENLAQIDAKIKQLEKRDE